MSLTTRALAGSASLALECATLASRRWSGQRSRAAGSVVAGAEPPPDRPCGGFRAQSGLPPDGAVVGCVEIAFEPGHPLQQVLDPFAAALELTCQPLGLRGPLVDGADQDGRDRLD